jgi:hypothetical protein
MVRYPYIGNNGARDMPGLTGGGSINAVIIGWELKLWEDPCTQQPMQVSILVNQLSATQMRSRQLKSTTPLVLVRHAMALTRLPRGIHAPLVWFWRGLPFPCSIVHVKSNSQLSGGLM